MKLRRLVTATLLLALVIPAPLALAQERKAGADMTELEAKMEKMNTSWRKLRRQVGDAAQNASSLELIAAIREAVQGAEKLTPARITEIPDADRAKFLAAYQAGMRKFYEQLDALEAAIKAGNNGEADKVYRDIADHQRASHKEFKKAPPEKQ